MNRKEAELIRDYLDGRITESDLEKLNRLLESDAGARAEFRAMATMEEGLRDLCVMNEIDFPHQEDRQPPIESQKKTKLMIWAAPLALAALLLLYFGLSSLFKETPETDIDWGEAVARIEFLDEDVQFAPDHRMPETEGSFLTKGWFQLERGRVRILFRSGATVEAEGPAALGIDTPMRTFLDFGKVNVHAPESARDFVVATESMEVVDLGTRFEVEVDPSSRESNVTVTEGLVDLHLGSRGAERTIRPLEAGYAAKVDAFGQIVEITSPTKTTSANTSLMAHWSFDRLNNGKVIKDSSTHSLDATLNSPSPSPLTEGIQGQALNVSKGDFVDLRPHLDKLSELKDFTFSAWVRDPSGSNNVVFSLSGDSEQHRIQLYVTRGYVRFGWQDGEHFDSISGRVNRWVAGKWYHVAVAVEGGRAHLYRNGELIASGSVGSKIGTPVGHPSLVKNPSHAYLGRLHDGRQGEAAMAQDFAGLLDEVQIYSGGLNQEAVRFLFENPGKSFTTSKQ